MRGRRSAPGAPARDTLSLHDALPIWRRIKDAANPRGPVSRFRGEGSEDMHVRAWLDDRQRIMIIATHNTDNGRSEEHTSELQSRQYLVCRLLHEKKNQQRHLTQDYPR